MELCREAVSAPFSSLFISTTLRKHLGKLFADDLKLYTTVRTVTDQANLQAVLDLLVSWSGDWQLAISPTKCAILLVSKNKHNISSTDYNIGDETLPTLHSIKDLGITVDQSLKFSDHIRAIVSKIRSRSILVFKCFYQEADIRYYRPTLHLYGQLLSMLQLCGRQRQSVTSN